MAIVATAFLDAGKGSDDGYKRGKSWERTFGGSAQFG